jgi:hypothetical protein
MRRRSREILASCKVTGLVGIERGRRARTIRNPAGRSGATPRNNPRRRRRTCRARRLILPVGPRRETAAASGRAASERRMGGKRRNTTGCGAVLPGENSAADADAIGENMLMPHGSIPEPAEEPPGARRRNVPARRAHGGCQGLQAPGGKASYHCYSSFLTARRAHETQLNTSCAPSSIRRRRNE